MTCSRQTPARRMAHFLRKWSLPRQPRGAGTAGAAQALVTAASLRDAERLRPARRGVRLMAMLGSMAGAEMLIADLKTPQRFYNMLRILRPTSPMSFGTYIFGAFGATSLMSRLNDLPTTARQPPLRLIGKGGQIGSALSGAGIATYTAALLSGKAATERPEAGFALAQPSGEGRRYNGR